MTTRLVWDRISSRLTFIAGVQVDDFKSDMTILVDSLPATLADGSSSPRSLPDAPPDLRVELTRRIVGGKDGMFYLASEEYFKQLFSMLHPLKCCPDEVIFEVGDRANTVTGPGMGGSGGNEI